MSESVHMFSKSWPISFFLIFSMGLEDYGVVRDRAQFFGKNGQKSSKMAKKKCHYF